MTTPVLTDTKHNFSCVIQASLELINLPLIDILANHVKDVDLFKKINSCQTLMAGKNKLRAEQLQICCLKPPDIPKYQKFDVSLLYTLIRNLCPSLRPTQGWGCEPHKTDTQLGDDIERLRLFRNNYYAHAVSEEIPDTEFRILWNDLKSVINRIKSKMAFCVDYEKKLIAIENTKCSLQNLELCKKLAEVVLRKDERDEPDVIIKGKDEVICGDPARFEAVLKPDSTCWSITWQKRRGKDKEIIDTSTRKYSGSTNRNLVIQSVCKEDEGEYQALLSHKSYGYKNIQCGHTICLHVSGELPVLNALEVTTFDTGIIIHYNYYVPGQLPVVQRVEWSKNDQVLDTNTSKYVGGSIFDKSLTIRLPTEEDKGKYSCKITNAVGSAPRSVILDAPDISIPVNQTVIFGSTATIKATVLSIPSPEQVQWQKSKDGTNFHCIDIKKPNYFGSKNSPCKPSLIIPKATFDDKLYYRLLVRNKIRESISDTVYLNVTGSHPNITTSQETNTKNRTLKLIGNVSLYDDSPHIQEVFWTKNGEKIDTKGSGGRLSLVTIDNPSLTIKEVSNDDAGQYRLTAVNAVGSTTSDVIVLDIPEVFFKKTENKEDGSQRYLVTIQSVPSPFSVQWSLKSMDEDMYTPIDVNDEDYKGTVSTLPHPVLVVKKNQLENNSYQIEVANFIGCTIQQIIGNQTYSTENKTNENKIYKNLDAGIKFAKLSNCLAKQFPHQQLDYLKNILRASGKLVNLSSLMSAKSALECISILQDENLFSQKDVIFMQFLCKETGCDDLYLQCIKYASKNKALCYFEKPPENGYRNVQFHIQGNLNDYTKEHQNNIVEVVADILDCETQDIFVNGIKPSNSFFLVLSLKEVYTWKLSKMDEQDRLKLRNLNIDFVVVDKNTIYLQNLEGEGPLGMSEREKSNFPKEGRIHISLPSCSSPHMSTQYKRGRCFRTKNLEEKEKEIDLELNRQLDKRHRTSSDQELYCSVKKDLSGDKHDDVRVSTVYYSRSQSMPPLVESNVVSAKANSCYYPDYRCTVEKNENVHKSSEMISYKMRTRHISMLNERCHKLFCAETQAIHRQIVTSSTEDLITHSDPQRKCLHSPKSNISFPVRSKGKLILPVVLGEEASLSPLQAYQGYDFPLKLGNRGKAKSKYKVTMGEYKLDGRKMSSQQE